MRKLSCVEAELDEAELSLAPLCWAIAELLTWQALAAETVPFRLANAVRRTGT